MVGYEAYGFSIQGFHVFLTEGLELGQTNRDAEKQDMLTGKFSRDDITKMIQSGEIRDAPTIGALGLLVIFEQE